LAEQLQLRQGNATQCAAFTGAVGECVVDTTNNRIIINDGATEGGWPAAKLNEVELNTRTTVADIAYTILSTDRLIAYTQLTNNRTVTLPHSTSFPLGAIITIVDESGNCSITSALTIAVAGSDTINGFQTEVVIQAPYGYLRLETNQNGKWIIVGWDFTSNMLGLPISIPATVGVAWLSGGVPEISQP
jgi:hypothetical protein